MENLLVGGLAALGAFWAVYLFGSNFERLIRRLKKSAGQASLKPADKRPWLGDAASQLRYVMTADFKKKKIMSKAEYSVFKTIEDQLRGRPGGYRVLAQTSLGEILSSEDPLAFGCINSKRVDSLIIGPYGEPLVAVEYQGGLHHQGNAAARDAVKKEALRKAGVQFIEIDGSHSSEEIRQLIARVLWPEPSTNVTPPQDARPSGPWSAA